MSEPPEATDSQRTPDVLMATVVVEGSVLLLALVVGWFRGESPWNYVRWEWAACGWALMATVPPVALAWLMLRFPVGPLKQLGDLSRQMVHELFGRSPVWQLIFVSTWAGVAEELLFRGVVQQIVGEYSGPLLGILAGSLIFGLAHPLSATYFVVTALMGAYLGWLWIASDGNLLVPMIVHGLYDFLLLLLMKRGAADTGERPA